MTKRRVLRGGSCYYGTLILRSTDRIGFDPKYRSRVSGFRIVVRRRKKQ